MVFFATNVFADTPRSTGKYKNWESFTVETDKGKFVLLELCLQKEPLHQFKEGSQTFVTFRPSENIKDEVSLTSGHEYKSSTVVASSGKKRYSFFSQKILHGFLMTKKKKLYKTNEEGD